MKRYSKNREAILECLKSTKSHPTAEWVYARLKPDFPCLSLGTVYRNLTQLKEAGLINSVGSVAGYEHFDADISPHNHVICTTCGNIVDLTATPDMDKLMGEVGRQTDFGIAQIKFLGVCTHCKSKLR